MKGICILIIGLAFILSYQKNPLGTIIIGGVSILIYAFFKSRKRTTKRRGGWAFSKSRPYRQSHMEDLINLLIVQNYLKERTEPSRRQEEQNSSPKLQEIEALKNQILSLFDED